jgi:hypothetical protein
MRTFYGNFDNQLVLIVATKDLDPGDAYCKVIFICRCSRGVVGLVTRV